MTALIPDPEALSQFVDLMFKYASRDSYVSFRAFRDNGNMDVKPILIQAVRLDDPEFIPLMVERARQAANWDGPRGVLPAGHNIQGPSKRQDRQHPRRRRP